MVRDRLNDLVGPIPNSFDPNTRSVVDLAVQRFEHLPHLWIIWIRRSMIRRAPRMMIRNSIGGRASRFLEGWANARFVKACMIDGLAIPGG